MRQYPASDSKEVTLAKVRPGKRVAVIAVLLCAARTLVADTQHEHVVRELYRHAVQVPASVIQVRALVHYIEPAWTEAKWEEYYRNLRNYGIQNPPEIAEQWRKYLEHTHASGIRWSLVKETKLAGFYRLDRKDYYGTVGPTVDDRLLHSDDVFDQYFINNYSRKELPFRTSYWDGQTDPAWVNRGTRDNPQWEQSEPTTRNMVFLEAGPYKQENLFVARYLEAEAGFYLVMFLGKFDVETIRRLRNTPVDEHKNLIPPVPLDERKLRETLSGRNPALKISVVPSGGTGASVELSSDTHEGETVAQYTLDSSLPYLVSRIRVIPTPGIEYVSERSGLTDLGFPAHWRTERNTPDGRQARKVWILSATTNVVESNLLGTNYPAGAEIYRGDQRTVQAVAGGNQPTADELPPQLVPTEAPPAAQAHGWIADRRLWAAAITVMALAVILILRKVAMRR